MSVNTPPNQTRLIVPDGHSCRLRRAARVRHMLDARVKLASTDPLGEEIGRHAPVRHVYDRDLLGADALQRFSSPNILFSLWVPFWSFSVPVWPRVRLRTRLGFGLAAQCGCCLPPFGGR